MLLYCDFPIENKVARQKDVNAVYTNKIHLFYQFLPKMNKYC